MNYLPLSLHSPYLTSAFLSWQLPLFLRIFNSPFIYLIANLCLICTFSFGFFLLLNWQLAAQFQEFKEQKLKGVFLDSSEKMLAGNGTGQECLIEEGKSKAAERCQASPRNGTCHAAGRIAMARGSPAKVLPATVRFPSSPSSRSRIHGAFLLESSSSTVTATIPLPQRARDFVHIHIRQQDAHRNCFRPVCMSSILLAMIIILLYILILFPNLLRSKENKATSNQAEPVSYKVQHFPQQIGELKGA